MLICLFDVFYIYKYFSYCQMQVIVWEWEFASKWGGKIADFTSYEGTHYKQQLNGYGDRKNVFR